MSDDEKTEEEKKEEQMQEYYAKIRERDEIRGAHDRGEITEEDRDKEVKAINDWIGAFKDRIEGRVKDSETN